MVKKAAKLKLFFPFVLALITATIWSVYFSQPDEKLNIYFFDVGQGDAELIQKANWQILVDGGPDDIVIERISNVMPIDDRKIETIIITHPHADHITGLIEVINRYEIEKIILTKVGYESATYKSLLELIDKKKIKTITPKIGDVEYLFDQGKITYLWPGEEVSRFENNLNNSSIVFRFDYGDFNCIFSGDAEIESWTEIFKKQKNNLPDIDVIKIPHHGSRTGLNENMTNIMRPDIAIISLGLNNKYGFPHQEILDILAKNKTRVYRTDQDKSINIRTDGKNYEIKTF
ncbi:MAG: MBL fold metallo-hydrolase [Patescibacteria group bacterium]|nr:MBL fold metallo-hydrolase [Patescibacteria group bacterium]